MDDVLLNLLAQIKSGRDVRIDVATPPAPSDYADAARLANERAAMIASGSRVARVYWNQSSQPEDAHREYVVTRHQARRLLAAGARWIGSKIHEP
jgi:hypothetical protein